MLREMLSVYEGKKKSKAVSQKIIGQGTFGTVFQAIDTRNGKLCAIKTVLQDKKYKNRQLSIVSLLNHINLIKMDDYYFTLDKGDYYLNIVMEYVPDSLYRMFKQNGKQKLPLNPIIRKILSFQLFKALYYLKINQICHRDLKPPNILINDTSFQLKICDFGSAKILEENEVNVAYICSRYYRAPELIFGKTDYSTQIDMWSAGCIMVEMITLDPIFPGDSSIEQLIQIVKILGSPSQQFTKDVKKSLINIPFLPPTEWQHILGNNVQQQFIDLIEKILNYDAKNRLTPYQALLHPYFKKITTYTKQLQKLPHLLEFKSLYNGKNLYQIETLENIYKFNVSQTQKNRPQSMISTFCAQ